MQVYHFYLLSLMVFLCCVYENKGKPVDAKFPTDNHGADAKILFSRFLASSPTKISYSGSYPAGATSCTLDPIPPILSQDKWVPAAVSKEEFFGSLVCGTCVRISVIDLTKDEDPDNIFASIVDSCNDCEKGEISLYTDKKGKQKANYQAVDCFGTNDGEANLRAVIRSTEKGFIKVQVKNSLLPIVGLELFNDGRWQCLPREIDNHFYIYDQLSQRTPIQFRVTSITGETVGFSVANLTSNEEIILSRQFKPFMHVPHDDKEAEISCYGQPNATEAASSSELTPSTRSKDAVASSQADATRTPKVSNNTDANSNFNASMQSNNSNNARIESSETLSTPLNASFCKQKADGTYASFTDCRQFILCSQGVAHGKTCPNGLRFNFKEGVCDWPNNVNCANGSKDPQATASSQNAVEMDDEEIYTRKFMKQKSNS